MRTVNRKSRQPARKPARRVVTPGARGSAAPKGPGPIDRLERFFLRHKALRRALGLAVIGSVLGAGVVYADKSGMTQSVTQSVSDQARDLSKNIGFAVSEVTVTGRSRTDKTRLLSVLGIERNDPILWFDADQARQSLETLPWVRHARVSRQLPGRVHIELVEREPYAIWQHKGELALIDRTGTVIQGASIRPYRDLPLVVGEEARLIAHEIVDLVVAEPLIGPRVDAVVRVGGRRWTLRLDNGIDVDLPEADARAAIESLSVLEREHQILSRDILGIDLRLPDRIVLRTDDDGAGFRLNSARGEDL